MSSQDVGVLTFFLNFALRIGDEKSKLEQSLATERKQKDKEIKDALLLQEALLVEKESKLNGNEFEAVRPSYTR